MKKYFLTAVLLFLAACGGAGQLKPQPQPTPEPKPTPVGTPVGVPTTKVIGSSGGTLELPGGSVKIEIPAGALSKDQTVGIQEITNNAPAKFGKAYRLTPEGTQFANPVKLSFAFTEAQLDGTSLEALNIGYQKDGFWKAVPVVARDSASRTVTVETTHFSDWSPVPGAQLDPGMAHIKEGQTLNLKVVVCDPEKTGPLEGTFACGENVVASHVVRKWSVNDTPGGSQSLGYVNMTEPGHLTYQAPATKPRPNSVAVSAELSALDGGLLILVSHVVVGNDDSDWQGTITYSESGSRENPARDGFTGVITDKYTQNQTFTVVGVKETNGPRTTLLLRQSGSAKTTRNGGYHREIYEICQAFGPVILRYWDDYKTNLTLEGSVDATYEADLYQGADGGYSLSVPTKEIAVKGDEAITDIHKDGCAKTTTDNSKTKHWEYSDNPAKELYLVGSGPDASNPNRFSGGWKGDNASAGLLSVPTHWSLNWELTRVTKP